VRDDWQSMLINAALMSVAGLVLLMGRFMLAVKALCRMVRR
jgi:hypothetical protein